MDLTQLKDQRQSMDGATKDHERIKDGARTDQG